MYYEIFILAKIKHVEQYTNHSDSIGNIIELINRSTYFRQDHLSMFRSKNITFDIIMVAIWWEFPTPRLDLTQLMNVPLGTRNHFQT